MNIENLVPTKANVQSQGRPCPSPELLKLYLDGTVSEEMGSQIDTHIEECARCNDSLGELESEEDQLLQQAIETARMRSPSTQTSAAGSWFGPYRLVKRIGRGGMGEVYEAEHTKLKRAVAIKLLPLEHASSLAVDRFEREIAAAGKLVHPSIVLATDAGNHGQFLYLAMELVDGWDLAKLARGLKPLPIPVVCEMGRQVAMALAHAHAIGMVHRDIKPSNIMLDRHGHIKLLDFGLVMFEPWNNPIGELTTVGQFLGTLDYIAPEQAERSSQVDFRCDLYSLGATLFKLLTGHLPLAMYPHQSPIEKLRAISEHKPLSVQTFRSEVPEALCQLIEQMLNSAPKARPTSAAHIAESLAPFCERADLKEWVQQVEPALLLEDASEDWSADRRYPAVEAQPLVELPTSSRWGRGWQWIVWTAVALLPFAAWSGIRFVLEDKDCNLVIESESEVRVRLLQGEHVVKELSVQQGNSVTKLRSGKYEITIDTPSNNFTVDQSVLSLKQGETVIARITQNQVAGSGQKPATTSTNDSLAEKLISLGLESKTLSATYHTRTILERIRVLESELDIVSWRNSLGEVTKALSKNDRRKLQPFVRSLVDERNGEIPIYVWLDLDDWFEKTEIDSQLLKQFADQPTSKFFDQLKILYEKITTGKTGLLEPDDFRVEDFPSTFALIEKRISDMSHSDLIRSISKLGGNLHLTERSSFADELFRLYPATAFATCRYYQSASTNVIEDPSRHAIRLQSKLTLATRLFETKEYEKWLWIVSQTGPMFEGFESPEKDFWKLVATQASAFLDDWRHSSEVIPANWATPNYSKRGRNSGMGRGGEVSGFGVGWEVLSQSNAMLARGGESKISVGIEVLLICGRIPKSLRPITSLELLRTKLAAYSTSIESDAAYLATLRVNEMLWNDEGKLSRVDAFGKSIDLGTDNREALEAAIIRRWIGGLTQSDFESPADIAFSFFASLQEKSGPTFNREYARTRIVSRGRKTWTPESSLKLIPKIGEHWFSPTRLEVMWNECKVWGQLDEGNGQRNGDHEIEISMELEPDGWRIRRIVERTDVHGDEKIFEIQ